LPAVSCSSALASDSSVRASTEARLLSSARRPARMRASAMAAEASALVSLPLRRALVRISSVSVTSRSRASAASFSSRRFWSSSALRRRADRRSVSAVLAAAAAAAFEVASSA